MPKPKPGPGAGRPRTTMTDARIKDIIRMVRLGVWPDRAAAMFGVNKATMRAYRMRNVEFSEQIDQAEAEAEASFHAKALRHMDSDFRAVRFMLERRWPERWGEKDTDPEDPEEKRDRDPRFE